MTWRHTSQVHDDGTPTTRTFDHVKSEIGAEEAEEVGVEHLLRDIKDTTVGTLSQHLTTQVMETFYHVILLTLLFKQMTTSDSWFIISATFSQLFDN